VIAIYYPPPYVGCYSLRVRRAKFWFFPRAEKSHQLVSRP